MNLSTWADIAVVFLAIQCFIIMLIPLVVVFFLVRGINMAVGALPTYLTKAQGFTRLVRDRTVGVGAQVAEPLVRFRSQQLRLEASVRSFSTEVGDTIYGPRESGRNAERAAAVSQGAQDESES